MAYYSETKCKYCKWYKVGDVWTSICTNENCYDCNGGECIEKIGYESEPCDDKVEEY